MLAGSVRPGHPRSLADARRRDFTNQPLEFARSDSLDFVPHLVPKLLKILEKKVLQRGLDFCMERRFGFGVQHPLVLCLEDGYQ
jgi:hypothetical protein